MSEDIGEVTKKIMADAERTAKAIEQRVEATADSAADAVVNTSYRVTEIMQSSVDRIMEKLVQLPPEQAERVIQELERKYGSPEGYGPSA